MAVRGRCFIIALLLLRHSRPSSSFLLLSVIPAPSSVIPASSSVIPAKAGTHLALSVSLSVYRTSRLGSRLRGNDVCVARGGGDKFFSPI